MLLPRKNIFDDHLLLWSPRRISYWSIHCDSDGGSKGHPRTAENYWKYSRRPFLTKPWYTASSKDFKPCMIFAGWATKEEAPSLGSDTHAIFNMSLKIFLFGLARGFIHKATLSVTCGERIFHLSSEGSKGGTTRSYPSWCWEDYSG